MHTTYRVHISIFFMILFFSCRKIEDIYEPEIKIVSVNELVYLENSSIEANPGDIVKMELSYFCEKEFESATCANTKGKIYDYIKTDGEKGAQQGTLYLEVDVDDLWEGSLFGGVFTIGIIDKEQNLGTKSIQINRKR